MSKFTTLKALGLENLRDIQRYRLSNQGHKDLLEIFFDHESKESQPQIYRFDRHQVKAIDAKTAAIAKRSEGTDPFLLAVIKELNLLFKAQGEV